MENALKAGQLTAEQKSAMNRQLCMSIMGQHSGQLTAAERNQVAMMLIQKIPMFEWIIWIWSCKCKIIHGFEQEIGIWMNLAQSI